LSGRARWEKGAYGLGNGLSPAGDEEIAVELVGVRRNFGQFQAVRDVSFQLGNSQFLTLLGASGSGKSTTLMMIAGFLEPSAGEIFLAGRRANGLEPHKRNLGVVFQNYALFPHMTVFDNLAFPLRTRGFDRNTVNKRVGSALELVHLGEFTNRMPIQLSGGQQQRIALARALIYDPPVLLMDEPLGALDRRLRVQLQLEIKRIQRERRVSVIYVTHDQDEALTMSDRIAVMDRGRVVQIGHPEDIYDRPETEFVAAFVGDMNFFRIVDRRIVDGTKYAVTEDLLAIRRPEVADQENQSSNLAVLRPERILIGPTVEPTSKSDDKTQTLTGVIEDIIYTGESRRYVVRVGPRLIVVKRQSEDVAGRFARGDHVSISWRVTDVRWLP